jgi:hypothetical protein
VSEAPLVFAGDICRTDGSARRRARLLALCSTTLAPVLVALAVPGLLLTAFLIPALGHDRLLGTVELWAEFSLARGYEARISNNHRE